jgi:A/G-specific adenine glycosylase
VGRLTRHDRIAVELLKWGSGSLRDLPWRRTRDPWRVLVSEVMLQQTSVARVLPKFEAFIDEFPTPAALANAALGDALKLWTGLGYPRRCRNLREAAIAITEVHHGEFPRTLDELLALPGIGQYTARAVLAFAFDETVAVVDTNVSRVLSRLEGVSMTSRQLQTLADVLVPEGLGWEWNQVIMDFGARMCTARSPECGSCSLSRLCAWRGVGDDPAPKSAGASRPQARFEGSDRQARGRALRAVADGVTRDTDVLRATGLDDSDRAGTLVDALVSEGLLVRRGRRFTLP